MKDNFNLRKFLTENQLTRNSKIIYESTIFKIDDSNFDDFLDIQNEYVIPEDYFGEVDHESLSSIVIQNGKELFDIDIEGIDPSSDGTERYYSLSNPEILSQIAELYSVGENYELADQIQNGEVTGFLVFTPLQGTLKVLPLLDGFEEIKDQL